MKIDNSAMKDMKKSFLFQTKYGIAFLFYKFWRK